MMMSYMGLGINRSANFTLSIWGKLLVMMGEADIGPIPATITTITQATMLYCCIYLVLIGTWMIVFMKMKEVTVGVMVKDVDVGINISATLHSTIM